MVIAGVLSLRGALKIVANRARLMIQKCATLSTGMIAVNLCSKSVETALRSSDDFSGLTIACYNSPTDCVVSGPLIQLQLFKTYIDSHMQCRNAILQVPFGYHSSAMDVLAEDLTSIAKGVSIHSPNIPIVSNPTGGVVYPGDNSVYDTAYFSRHCIEPVRFETGICSLLSKFDVVDAWIEIGPNTTTLPMLRSNASLSQDALFLASINKRHDPWLTLNASLESMYISGIRVLWREVFSHVESVKCVSLPSYPFTKSKHWISYTEPEAGSQSSHRTSETAATLDCTMLHSFSQYPSSANGQVAIFETPISHVASFITGHRVGGLALCPASVYLEQVYAGLDLTMRHLGVDSSGGQPILRDIQFSKPLVYHETVERVIVTSIEFGASSGSFSISSRVGASEESVHCHGVYKVQPSARMKSKFAHSLPGIERRIDALLQPHCKQPEMFTTRTVYDVIFPRVVKYSKEYQTIKSLCVSADGFEGFANVELLSQSSLIVEPVFVDTLLHAAGFIANMQGGPEDGYICSEVGAVRILPKSIKPDTPYTVYCSNSWIPERNTILAEAFALTSERKVVAHLKGMHFKRMRLRSFVSVLKAAAEGNIQLNDIVKGKTDLTTISATVRFKPTHSASTGPDFISSVISVVAEACALDVTDVKPDSELSELGVDSLMTIEIVQNLRKILPDSCIDSFAFSNLYSVRQIAEEIRARIDKPSATSTFSTPACSTPTQIDDCAMLFPSDELNIKAIISSVLDISIHDVEDDRELDSLGLDSLTSIEALAALREQSSLDVPTDLFLSCKTTRALQEFFAARAHSQNVTSSGAKAALRPENIPLLIQNPDQRTTKGSAPLILFHDGSGLTNYYNGLPPLNRLVWAINNPRFETGEPWQSIQQMTTDYADRVQRLGQNQVILGGWSFGGVAAYETCVQLQTRGVNVKGIILIDTPEPFDHVPLSEALISAVVSLERSESGIRKLVKAQFAMNSRLLTSYCAQALGDACPPLIFLRSKEGFRHPEIPNIPRWLADRSNPESTTQGWRKLAGSRLTVLDIPGDHFGPFNRTNAAEVFGTIQRALGLLDKP